MDEYISRREAIKARKRSCDKNCLECDFAIEGDSWCNGEVFVVDLLRIPAADVRPVRYGKWENHGWSIRCSECGYDMPFATRNFCPNCGAMMEES